MNDLLVRGVNNNCSEIDSSTGIVLVECNVSSSASTHKRLLCWRRRPDNFEWSYCLQRKEWELQLSWHQNFTQASKLWAIFFERLRHITNSEQFIDSSSYSLILSDAEKFCEHGLWSGIGNSNVNSEQGTVQRVFTGTGWIFVLFIKFRSLYCIVNWCQPESSNQTLEWNTL